MLKIDDVVRKGEEWILVAAIALAVSLPLIDAVGRPLGGFHIPGSSIYVQQVTLWLAFVGGLAATRQKKHLTLSTAELVGEREWARRFARLVAGATAAAVVAALAWASIEMVRADRQGGRLLPNGIPEWASECIMPATLAIMAILFIASAADGWKGRAIAVAVVAATFGFGLVPAAAPALIWPVAIVLVVAGLWGAPVFVVMGGLAMLLFFRDGTPIGAVSAEIYRLVASPTLPAIPLLTAAGYILAESKSSSRLVRLFQALFGFMPGGIAVAVAASCAIFTTFTGGSGVTIIALGGLVLPMLLKARYSEGFSLGLITASGSLGMLFPPSLAVILYSVVAQVPADNLYLAGLLPGALSVVLVAAYGIQVGMKVERERMPFSFREALAATWGAKWELILPLFVIVLFASGLATIVEASAAACAYAVIIATVVSRDIRFRDLPAVLVKSGALVGAVMFLLSIAMGMTSYLVDAQIPDALLAWVQMHVHSQIVFLLALNVVLLVLGSVLEIFSAIIVLAPLVVPMATAFGIDPVHLGVIFLVNLELGFLFPPVGLNLFLASARFGVPLPKLYRHVVPFLLIGGARLLLVTYIPELSLGILRVMGRM